MKKKDKVFIIDTNVILHDSNCIREFEEHDIIVPITVIEELDKFKKGDQTVNFHARKFTRKLDSLSGESLFNGGVSIGEGLGKIFVKLESCLHKDLKNIFPNVNKPDHQILNIAYCYKANNPDKKIVVVSKDVNLRLKAKSVGLTAQDYTSDHIDTESLHTDCMIIENVEEKVIDHIRDPKMNVLPENLGLDEKNLPHNQCLIVRVGKKSVLAIYRDGEIVWAQHAVPVYGIIPRNAEQIFTVYFLRKRSVPLVTISGKAGTGKTLLALAGALEERGQYRQILLARPIVPLSNKDVGYLPGDVQSKIKPYMQPLYDNLGVIKGQYPEQSEYHQRLNRLLEEEKLVIEPLAYIRGRSLVGMYMIVDEAQNLTPHEVKTVLTRAGEGTKMIFTGDTEQVDHPYLDSHSNGLSYLMKKMYGHPLYGHITLKKGERSELSRVASQLL